MSASDCCNASGGRTVFTVNGKQYSARTALKITPFNFERSVVANQDGTPAVQTKPVPAEAEITLSDSCGLDLTALMSCPLDVTCDLIDMRRKYLFSKGVVVGRPTINTETGEITNVKVTSQQVTIVNY